MTDSTSEASLTDEVAKLLLDFSGRLQWLTDERELKKAILDTLLALGWARARLYAYEPETRALVSEATRGLTPRVARALEGRKFVITRDESPNAYHWSSLEKGQPLVFVSGKHGRGPSVPHEDDEGRMVITVPDDPDAAKLGKKGVTEWLDLPLVASGTVLGKISVDMGHPPAHQIRREDFYAAALLTRMCAQVLQRLPKKRPEWERFEDEVASILRALGAKVNQNINLAGNQIDVLAVEKTPSGQTVRTVVECKKYRRKVGVEVVRQLAYMLIVLKERKAADRAMLVASSGFSKDAQLLADHSDLELVSIHDLRQKLGDRKPQRALPSELPMSDIASQAPRRIFVIMPFGTEYDDLYHLGIRETAQALDFVCERADEMEFTGSIPAKIVSSIRIADVVVAELTAPNPNVYYEVGVADTLRKPVVRLTKNPDAIPFDLKHLNHIVYDSIRQLREKLRKRLESFKSGANKGMESDE